MIRLLIIVVLPMLFINIGSLFYYKFSNIFIIKVSDIYLYYYVIDIIFTLVVIFLFLYLHQRDIFFLKKRVLDYYLVKISSYKIFYFVISVVFVYYSFLFLKNFFASSSIVELISEYRSSNYFSLLLKRIVEIALIIHIVSLKNKTNTFLLILSFSSFIIIGMSRTEIVVLFWLYIIYISFYSDISLKSFYKSILLLIVLIVLTSGIITFYQGRVDSFTGGILNTFDALFRYKVYTLYLAEELSHIPRDINQALFPFLGFLGERFVLFFGDFGHLISSNKSTFVSDFNYVGGGFKANALYPWWGWFVASWGIWGLILKAIFSYFILSVVVKFRLSLVFIYMIYLILIRSFDRHPLINASDFYSFIGLLIFEIFIFLSISELRKQYIWR